MAAICRDQYSRAGPHLFLAFELSNTNWKLGFTIGFGQRPRERNIRAGDLDALEREIGQAKERFGLPEDVPVLSCTVLRQHRLRGGAGRLLAASLSRKHRLAQPGCRLLQHRGQSQA